jgi:hypothetical protein
VTATMQEIQTLIETGMLNKNAWNNLNQTAYIMTDKWYKEEGIKLMEQVINANDGLISINYVDTLSDLYLWNSQYEETYKNDIKLLETFEQIRQGKQRKDIVLFYRRNYWTFSEQGFVQNIKRRYEIYSQKINTISPDFNNRLEKLL